MVLSRPSPAAHTTTQNVSPASASDTVQDPTSLPTNNSHGNAPAESLMQVRVARVIGHASSTVPLRHHATEAMEQVAEEEETSLGTNEAI
jgi:hypothetical protein